jgi:hypothetical protein
MRSQKLERVHTPITDTKSDERRRSILAQSTRGCVGRERLNPIPIIRPTGKKYKTHLRAIQN